MYFWEPQKKKKLMLMFFKFPTWKNLSTQIISASNLSCTLGGLDKKWPLQYLIFSFSITFKTQCHLWLYIFTFDNIYHKYITPLWLTNYQRVFLCNYMIYHISLYLYKYLNIKLCILYGNCKYVFPNSLCSMLFSSLSLSYQLKPVSCVSLAQSHNFWKPPFPHP